MVDTDENSIEEEEVVTPVTGTAGKRFRRLVLFLGGIALLPSLVTVTGISGRGLNWIHPELARVTEFDNLALHWWAPVECRGLRIRNTREWSQEAPPLLVAQRITTSEPLWRIAVNMGEGIQLTVVEPELNLVNTANGSNLNDAMQDLTGKQEADGSAFPFRVAIQNGRINVANVASQATALADEANVDYVVETLISGIQCEVSTLDTASVLPNVSLVAMLGNNESNAATAQRTSGSGGTTVHPRIAARLDDLAADFQPLTLETPSEQSEATDAPSVEIQLGPVGDDTQRALRFVARGLQLDVLEPLIAQLIPGVQCRGLLSVQGEAMMLGKSPNDGFALRAAVRAAGVEWRQTTWQAGEILQMSTASADCAIAVAEDGIIVQKLSVECPFASVTGDGEIRLPTEQLLKSILKSGQDVDAERVPAISEAEAAAAGQVNIRGKADLVALSRMLPQTLHLREGLQLQKGIIQFAVRTQSETSPENGLQTLDWQAVVETSPLIAQHNGKTLRWDAPVRLKCAGPLRMTSLELRSATLSGDFGQLTATPLDDALDVHGRINVDRLWSHLGQFIDGDAPGIRGEVQVDAYVGLPASGDVLLRDVKVLANNLQVESKQLVVRMDQPLLKMLDGQLSVMGTGAAVQSLAAPWTDLSWLAGESQVSVQLDAAPPERMTVVGEIRSGSTASVSPIPWQGTSTLRINQAQLALDIDTDSEPDHYIIRSGRLQIPGVKAQVSGTLETSGEWMTTQLVVDADYDLATLSRMALNDPNGDIRLTGRQKSRLTVQGTPAFWDGSGPADAEPFEVAGEIGWDSADVYGLQLGPATVPFRLKMGQLQTEPIRCSLNGGQLSIMVNYDLSQNQVALASGSRVEKIAVTEELASQWLGYVAPFLSDSAGVRGSVSTRVSRFRYDLAHPESSDIVGTVDIHGITASPGNSLSVLLEAMDTLRSGGRSLVRDLSIPTQQVQCQLRNGMITHDQLLLTVSGYNMRSRGSVGLNKQINLTLDIPLEKADNGTSGRMVSVPVHGTVSRPSIDAGRLLQNAGSQRIQSEIDDQLGRGLNQLFDKLR